jgi:tRNA nucleotidyltransferase (CCA-adding enzyme)
LEEIAHEEDGYKVLAAMETEGWMQHLFPAWTTAAADTAGLEEMRKFATQLQVQGVSPDISAASAHFLTAKLAAKDLAALKAAFVRPGFVHEWNNLDHLAKEFAKQLTSKEATKPSATWKLFMSADPQAVLWLGLTSKVPAVQAKYKNFFTVWPEAKQKIPYALFQEMRITPEVPGYDEMMAGLFLGVIDGELETDEQLRAFLEPYSPPAPPPPVTVRRSRGSRKSAEGKKAAAEPSFDGDSDGESIELDEDAHDESGEDPDLDTDDEVDDDESDAAAEMPAPPKKASARKPEMVQKLVAPVVPEPTKAVKAPAPPPAQAKAAAKPAPVKAAKPVAKPAASHEKVASHDKKAVPVKAVPAKAVAAKTKSHAVVKAVAKPAGKPAAKAAHPAKKAHAKPVVKPHKKVEPPKKAPAKKSVPAKKHR